MKVDRQKMQAAMSGYKSDLVAFVVILLLLGLFSPTAESLKCYVCTGVGTETECETALKETRPSEVIRTCKPAQKYCTIRRVEKTRFPGRVTSFARSCESDPVLKNEVDVGVEETTYFVSCQTELCNSGDGTFTLLTDAPNMGKPTLPSWAEILGFGSGSNHITASLTTLIASTLIWILHKHILS